MEKAQKEKDIWLKRTLAYSFVRVSAIILADVGMIIFFMITAHVLEFRNSSIFSSWCLMVLVFSVGWGIIWLLYKCLLCRKRTEQSIRNGLILGTIVASANLLCCFLLFKGKFYYLCFPFNLLCVFHIVKSIMLLKKNGIGKTVGGNSFVSFIKANGYVWWFVVRTTVINAIFLLSIGLIGLFILALSDCHVISECEANRLIYYLPIIVAIGLSIGMGIFLYTGMLGKRRTKKSLRSCSIIGIVCSGIVSFSLVAIGAYSFISTIIVGISFLGLDYKLFFVAVAIVALCVFNIIRAGAILKTIRKIS